MIPITSMLGLAALSFVYRYLIPRNYSRQLKSFSSAALTGALLTFCAYYCWGKHYEAVPVLVLAWAFFNLLWMWLFTRIESEKVANQEQDNGRNDP